MRKCSPITCLKELAIRIPKVLTKLSSQRNSETSQWKLNNQHKKKFYSSQTEDCNLGSRFSGVLRTVPPVRCLFSSVQSFRLFGTPMDCCTPGLPVHHQLLEFTQIHVHWVSDAIQPSYSLLSPSPSTFNPFPASGSFQMSQFFASGGQSIGVSASTAVLAMNIQDWFSLGQTGWNSVVQGTLKSLLQHHSSKPSILWHSAFLIVQLSHPYMTTGKTIALTRQTFVGKVTSLLFNMPSRLVITFLLRSERFFNFMAAVICSDFGAQENKVCFPIYLPWSGGTGRHDLSFLNVEL